MNQFSMVERLSVPRSQFDRSHGHKFVMDAGWLIPYYWDEVLPGDTFSMQTHAFIRMATPFFPVMDNAFVDTHFFYIPKRILWDNARKFFGEQANPGDSIDYTIPLLAGTVQSSSNISYANPTTRQSALLNYIGVPNAVGPNDTDIVALPFRAYDLIYREWFRDENLIDSPVINTGDGPDNFNTYFTEGLYRRGKRHDYFTSCLPFPQKGDAVSIPLGTTAPIQSDGNSININNGTNTQALFSTAGTKDLVSANFTNTNLLKFGSNTDITATGLEANLTASAGATINDLREAFQIQKLLERDARAGTRYPELLKNHFGVTFYDNSYRPEYLGGGSTPINISPVAQQAQNSTAGTTDGTGVGDLAAMGTASITGHGFTKSFNEHGYVMGIMSVRADLTYQKGLRRELFKQTRYDIYWPSLAHLGEEAVLSKEIYCDGTAGDEDVFGYQERYAHYRYKPSQISGIFQSDATASLDAWHLSQDFSTNRPTLGKAFIEEDPPFDRVIQVPSEPHFIVDTYNKLKCARPIPTYGTPGMIDHF